MFEDISGAPKREGVRGFIARHFGAITGADQARDELRNIASVFSGLAIVSAVIGAIWIGPLGAVDGFLMAILALLLRTIQSRIAAAVLLLLTVAHAILSLPTPTPIVWVLFALRAFQLTFAYHRLLKKLAPEDVAALSADSPSRSVPAVGPYAPPVAFRRGTTTPGSAVDESPRSESPR